MIVSRRTREAAVAFHPGELDVVQVLAASYTDLHAAPCTCTAVAMGPLVHLCLVHTACVCYHHLSDCGDHQAVAP